MNLTKNSSYSFSVLVAVENYPGSTNGKAVSHKFVHVRNLYYRSLGIDVTVLNFSESGSYSYEGLNVIGLEEFGRRNASYDLLLCHQPNLKHHLPFCKKHLREFKGALFFFHGHEVLKISHSYPKPYSYLNSSQIKIVARDMYDEIKFWVWRHYFAKIRKSAFFVFVSHWMYSEFMRWLRVNESFLADHAFIIPNCIGAAFETNRYTPISKTEFDFITIRGNLDTSKYALDLVVESALSNPNMKYLVIGKGDFFKHYRKPDNLTWLNTTLSHSEVIQYLNRSRCALMPTRTDAQGLMMCEMASFGIPLVTSDVPVCREVLDGFNNVRFIANDHFNCDLGSIVSQIPFGSDNKSPYSKEKTIGQEAELMRNIVQRGHV